MEDGAMNLVLSFLAPKAKPSLHLFIREAGQPSVHSHQQRVLGSRERGHGGSVLAVVLGAKRAANKGEEGQHFSFLFSHPTPRSSRRWSCFGRPCRPIEPTLTE